MLVKLLWKRQKQKENLNFLGKTDKNLDLNWYLEQDTRYEIVMTDEIEERFCMKKTFSVAQKKLKSEFEKIANKRCSIDK